jgi:ArsR family transcriptional regulator
VAGLARALGHPARIRIVRMLIEKQACIGCDLVDEIGLAQSTVSEHLRILKAAGIITTGEIERPGSATRSTPRRCSRCTSSWSPPDPPGAFGRPGGCECPRSSAI